MEEKGASLRSPTSGALPSSRQDQRNIRKVEGFKLVLRAFIVFQDLTFVGRACDVCAFFKYNMFYIYPGQNQKDEYRYIQMPSSQDISRTLPIFLGSPS